MTHLNISELRDLNNVKIKTSAQIVTAQKTDTWYSNSTSWIDVPGLSLNITPYSNTSKVFVIVKLSHSCYGHGGFRLYRNSTLIAAGDQRGSNRISELFDFYGTNSYNTAGWEPRTRIAYWLDSPASSSALTYKIQFAVPHSSSYYVGVNYNAYSNDNYSYNYNTSSSLTAMEIIQ